MRKGSHHSVESRRRMFEAKMGKPLSLETRKKMSEAMKGKTHSVETWRKVSAVPTIECHIRGVHQESRGNRIVGDFER